MAFSPSQMQFHVKADLSDRPRIEGKLAQGQKELAAENKRIAVVTQEFVVRHITSRYRRPLVSSGRLARVTAMPQNAYASAYNIGVGKPTHLDKSIAKYWRTIEEGSAATWKKRSFLSLNLLGVFGATASGGLAGPKFTLPGQGTGGTFLPIRPDPDTGTARFGNAVLRPFHPRHEIEPMGAYAAAYREAQFPENAVAAARKYLDEVLGTPLR